MNDFGSSQFSPQEAGLGAYLRHEREAKGLTLEQIAASTKITLRVLQSLEADHYEDLPAKPFVRGFVNAYCRALQLNGQEVLARYETFLDQRMRSTGGQESGVVGYAFEKKEGERSRTFLWVAMAVFVVFGGVGLLILKPALKRRQVSHLEQLKATPPSPVDGAVLGDTSPEALRDSAPLDLRPSEAIGGKEPEAAPPPPAPAPPPAPVAAPAPPPAEPKVFQKVPLVFAPPKPAVSVAAPLAEKKPEPKPETKPSEVVAEEKAPAPKETTGESPGESMEPNRKPDPEDALNKGDALVASDIRQKIVLKSLADVFVRYRVDEKPSMKMLLQSGKLLVLRAKQGIQVQVSNPNSVEIRFNKSTTYGPLKKAKNYDARKGNSFVAMSLDESLQATEIFNDLDALPSTPDPQPNASASP